jgi:5'-AMP-activated protein kinase, catalytic alpha subunit
MQDVAHRKIRFPSTHSPMDLFHKIEDVVKEMGFQVQKGPSKVDYNGVFTVTILRINAIIAETKRISLLQLKVMKNFKTSNNPKNPSSFLVSTEVKCYRTPPQRTQEGLCTS